MKAICIPAFNRPKLLQRAIASILTNHPDSGQWRIFVSVDHSIGCAREEIEKIVTYFKAVFPVIGWGQGAPMGCDLNSFAVCARAIREGAEAILFMDDDIFLSPDALALCDWYLSEPREGSDLGLALCRKEGNDPSKPNAVSARHTHLGHFGQGWFFTRKMWMDFILRHWWSHEPGHPDCWDWATCLAAQKHGKIVLRPRWARAQHAGAVGFHGPGLGVFPDSIANVTNCKFEIEP